MSLGEARELNDTEEKDLMRVLFAMLSEHTVAQLMACCESTNYRISAVVNFALMTTNFEQVESVLNATDSALAIQEAQEIIKGGDAPEHTEGE